MHTRKAKHIITDSFEGNEQLKIVQQFRKQQFHILISTSVTEEGFDIPQCNVIVSFNDTQSLQSYIQIKGRARMEDSVLYMLQPNQVAVARMKAIVSGYDDSLRKIRDRAKVNNKTQI